MTSKQRVLNAFNHIKSDRVPMNYMANPTIHAKVAKAVGASNYEEVLQALDIDFRGIYSPFKGENKFKQIDGLTVNPVYGFYTKWIANEHGGYEDFCNYPLSDVSEDVIENFHVPSADDFDYLYVAEQVKAYSSYGISCGDAGMADIINATGRVMGMEDTLCNLMARHAPTLNYISKRCDMELGKLERIIEAAKGGIDFLWMGEDLGTQHAPMISLEMYRDVLKPFHQKYVDLAKSYNLPVMIHTCGSSSWAYDEFISMGINAVDTLQPEAANMSPKYLVDKFGSKLAYHGCISTAGPLAYGNAEDLKKQIEETLQIMKPTYGYMLSPTHLIQDNSPVENVLALYKMGKEMGRY